MAGCIGGGDVRSDGVFGELTLPTGTVLYGYNNYCSRLSIVRYHLRQPQLSIWTSASAYHRNTIQYLPSLRTPRRFHAPDLVDSATRLATVRFGATSRPMRQHGDVQGVLSSRRGEEMTGQKTMFLCSRTSTRAGAQRRHQTRVLQPPITTNTVPTCLNSLQYIHTIYQS